MRRLIESEILKLRSTRTFWAITLGSLLLIAVSAAAISAATSFGGSTHPGRDTLAVAGMSQTFALLLGVLGVTSEVRYGTITPAFLITPRRMPVYVAKLVTLALGGAFLGLLAFGEAAVLALPILSARHVVSQVDAGTLIGIIVGGAIAAALAAAIGVGIGAIVRNQAGAIVAALGLLYVLEPLLSIFPGIGDAVRRFGLGGLASGASGTTGFPSDANILGQVPSAIVLATYALAVLIAGGIVVRRRDVAG